MVAKTPEPSLPRQTAGATPFSDSRAIAPKQENCADLTAKGSRALARRMSRLSDRLRERRGYSSMPEKIPDHGPAFLTAHLESRSRSGYEAKRIAVTLGERIVHQPVQAGSDERGNRT